MQKFVSEQNIHRYKDLLVGKADEAQKRLLRDMIAEEEANLKAANAASTPKKA